MPSSSIKLSLGTLRNAKGSETLLIALTKASLGSPKKISSALSAEASTAIAAVLKHKKVTANSGAVSVIDPAAASSKSVSTIILLPTDYTEKKESFDRLQSLRALGNAVADHARKAKTKSATVDLSALTSLSRDEQEALLEGILLSLYTFDEYRSKKNQDVLTRITLISPTISQAALTHALTVSDAVCLARDLVNAPARECTPSKLRATATAIAKRGKLGLKVYTREMLTKMGADLMMSVFRGSNETPYLLALTYKPRRAKKVVAIVGKGVTFDSGGLSIKSGSGMMDMKMDMAGAAAVLATMQAISTIRPDVEVHAYVPATENMINGNATRPGDVVRSLNGKTVEILNTDAEGRLILGDTLVLAEREKPDVIIDLATLTGAVIAAIGSDYAGLFSSSDTLATALSEAAALGGERMWRLPLAPEYKDKIKSTIADIKNIGGSEAGSITAALFLQEFVEKTDWAHLDIAGTAFSTSDKLATPKGGTGFGVRTLIRYIEGLA
jgi:leucyl aminopeptidase